MPTKRRRYARATERAFAGVVILTAAIAVGTPLYFFLAHVPRERRGLVESLSRELAARTDQRQMGLERWVQDELQNATTVAQFPAVRAVLTQGPSARRPARAEVAHVDELLALVAGTQRLGRALLVDGRADVVADGHSSRALAPGELRLMREAIAAGEPRVGFHRKSGTAHADIGFAAPVRDLRGRTAGAVLLEVDPNEWVYPFLTGAAPLLEASSEALLVEQRGDSVVWVSPRRKSSAPALADRRLLTDTRSLPLYVALRGGRRFGAYTDYTGAPVFASTRRIRGTAWGLVVKVDQEDIFGPFHRRVLHEEEGWGAVLVALLGLTATLWWSARRALASEVERGQARIAAALNESNEAILIVSREGRILDCNRRAEMFYGGGPGSLLGRPVAELRPEAERAGAAAMLAAQLQSETLVFETPHVTADGSVVPVEVSSRRVWLDGEEQIVSVIRDIRERKAAEARILRLNRMLRTLSEINQLMVRETDPVQLFDATCRIMVEFGGFRMAWIGLAEPGGRIRAVAHAGAEDGYLEESVMRWDEAPEGLGPTGTAVRERRIVVSPNYPADPAVADRRAGALARGYRSAVACPIAKGGEVAAVLTVYAGEPGVFDPEITALVEELAGDLGFALYAADDRAARKAAERALRATTGRLAALVDAAPVPIISVAPDGVVMSWNPAAERVFGWAAHEVLGRPSPIAPLEKEGEFRDLVARALGGTPIVGFQTQRRRKDGTLVDVLMSTAALPAATTAGAEVVALLVDLTELRRAQAALRESDAKLRAFFESNAAGMTFADVRGNIFDANDEFLRIVGYSREDLAAGRLRWADITPHEFAAAGEAAITEARARGACTPFEKQYIRKDGSRVWVLVGFVLMGEQREHSAAFIVDISAKKKAEAAVWLSEGRYRSLFQGMLEGYAHCRMEFDGDAPTDFVYLDVNPAFSALTGLKGVAGKRVTEVIPGIRESNPELFEIYGRVARTAEPSRVETYVPGVERWLSISVYCPAPGEFVAVFENITERRGAEEHVRRLNAELERRVAERTAQLEAVNKELEAFAYSVSHDLRAPLRAIDGFSRMLEEDHAARLNDEGRRLLGVVRHSTKGMGQLIDDLLAFSRAGRGELVRARVDMTQLVRDVWASLAPPEELAGVSFRVEPLPEAEADPALTRQVWTNLLSNAYKFTRGRRAPAVEVGSRIEQGRAVYFVRDNGVGFDPRYRDKLFGVFQRLHPSTEFEGTGVGLALVQRIVTRHGGAVWADGAVGEGATFTFTLPVVGDP